MMRIQQAHLLVEHRIVHAFRVKGWLGRAKWQCNYEHDVRAQGRREETNIEKQDRASILLACYHRATQHHFKFRGNIMTSLAILGLNMLFVCCSGRSSLDID